VRLSSPAATTSRQKKNTEDSGERGSPRLARAGPEDPFPPLDEPEPDAAPEPDPLPELDPDAEEPEPELDPAPEPELPPDPDALPESAPASTAALASSALASPAPPSGVVKLQCPLVAVSPEVAPTQVAPSAWHLQSVSDRQHPADCPAGTHEIGPPLLVEYVHTSVPQAVPASVQSTSAAQVDCARAGEGRSARATASAAAMGKCKRFLEEAMGPN